MHKSPLIISGIGRSGTSAVISSMSKHKLVVEPNRVGEAPFFNHFIKFLLNFEDNSPHKEYNLSNYQLDARGRDELFSNMLSRIQYGFDVDADSTEKKFWIAKVSLNSDSFRKACEMFSELRLIYVMRNGIEVVNSAKSFDGFKDLTFEQLCKRWAINLEECRYVHTAKNCAVVRHDELVVDPKSVYARVYEHLNIEHDEEPAKFISSTLFNSSFDKSAQLESTSGVFNNRLECWNEWSREQRDLFIDICDPYMIEFDFIRPYSSESGKRAVRSIEPNTVVTSIDTVAGNIAGKVAELLSPHMSIPQFDYHAYPSEKFGYLFMENPKVASTSTLKILQQHEDPDRARAMENTHVRDESPLPRFSTLTEQQQVRYFESDDIYRFAFVRNPYSRLLSAYLSKIDKPLRPKSEILAAIKGVNRSEITDLNEKVEFSDFVKVVCSQGVHKMNVHWKNQADQILFGKMDYAFIGKFETFQADFSQVVKSLFNHSPEMLKKSENKTNSDDRLREFYTPELADLVYSKFYEDFNAFGYDRSLSHAFAA